MPLINCKVELKLKWTKYCVLSELVLIMIMLILKILFLLSKLYVHVVTLSAKDNQKLSKLFSKELERSVYWNEYKTKIENKNTTNQYRYFLESNFAVVN